MELICAKKVNERVYDIIVGGEIGGQVNGVYVAGDIAIINKNKSADRINVRINSEGGSVINGIQIISAILNSRIPIHTYNDGYAMSMGGFIWLTAKKENRHMAEFARFMIHAPRFVDENGNLLEPESEDDKRLLDITKSQLATITKGSTGLTDNQVAKILGKDSFYTAEECYNAGFLPKANIIQYSEMPQFNPDANISENIQRIAAFYNDNNNQNSSKMKQLTAHLKLNPEASEIAVLDKVKSIEKERDEAMAEVKGLQDENNKNVSALNDATKTIKSLETKVKDFETKEAEAKKQAAITEVKAAIKDGFFKAENEDKLTAIAVDNIEAFRTMKDSVNLTVEAPDITAHLTGSQLKGQIESLAAKYGVEPKNFNYEYLWKNNEAKLKEMEKEDPKVHALLLAEFEKSES